MDYNLKEEIKHIIISKEKLGAKKIEAQIKEILIANDIDNIVMDENLKIDFNVTNRQNNKIANFTLFDDSDPFQSNLWSLFKIGCIIFGFIVLIKLALIIITWQ